MTPKFETSARRILVVPLVIAGLVALAGPASADVPVGWSDPKPVNMLHALLILGGIPVLLLVVIVAAVYIPALIRGERIAPGAPAIENQWLGGPRLATAQLAGPDSVDSEVGGASVRW